MVFWLIENVLLALVMLVSTICMANQLPADEKNDFPPDQWFTQYLDHFTITDNRQWKQRYQVITDFYKDGGPVFIQLGRRGPIYGDSLMSLTVTTYAEKFGALVFQLEHRFYGESHPTSDASTANLVYLTTEQILADIAYFIHGMTKEHKLPEGTKWIVFGFANAGNLAAWMRDKYPHLVYAAVADSAPLLAKVNFYEFLDVVKEMIASHDPKCVTIIQEAHAKVKELLKTKEGQKILLDKFKFCDTINASNKNDVIGLLGSLIDNFSEIVLYNSTGGLDIKDVCDVMLNTTLGDPLDRYAEVNIMSEDGSPCTNYKYDTVISSMKKIAWDADLVQIGSRQSFYEDCTQFGFFQTSVKRSQLFSEDIPLDWFFQQCIDVFGDNFNKDLTYKGEYRTNTLYGGLACQATRVAYIYSETDPWHVLGNSETKVAESPVIFIKGGSHQVILEGLTVFATPVVQAAWNQVQDIVGKWSSAKN